MDMNDIKTLKEMIDYGAAQFGDTDFIRYKTSGGVEAKTYRQLKAASDAFSRMLEGMGFEDAHVAVVGPTSFEWIVTFFGTACSGAAAIPLAPGETDEMNCKLIEYADTDVFVFDKKHKPLFEMLRKTNEHIKLYISVDDSSDDDAVINISQLLESYEGEYNGSPDPDKMCSIVFTSGTTGFPKGVMLCHRNYAYSAISVHVACPTKMMFCCLPIHHCFCFTANITKSIVRGKTVCVNDSLSNIIPDLRLFKPDSIIAVPQLIKKIMGGALKYAASKPALTEKEAVEEFLGGNIIDIISGGAPLDAAANERYNKTGILVLNGYGMTECAPIISNNAVGCFRHGSVGKPIPCMSAKIENGEILVKGPSIMLGYYKNEAATAEAFTPDGWLHTGDLGHFDDDGFLYVTGRCKNLILLDNGENVSAELLEDKLSFEPMLTESVCFGENGTIYAEVYLNQTYIAENGITDIHSEMTKLLARVNSSLAAYQRISDYIIRETPFERTSSGKIKRGLHGKIRKAEIVAPSTPAERKVCSAVKELLMKNEVSAADNFFAIGGDSLTAVELALSLNIKPQTVYDNPYLNALARALEEEQSKKELRVADINTVIADTKQPDTLINGYKTVLLTGATGFLGVHILKELVNSSINVICLVRNEKKLKSQIEAFCPEIDLTKISVVTGNIEEKNLSLSPESYASLAHECDAVFHVAANVHHAGDYSELERTNVSGTANIIEFAKTADAVLHHTSTVSLHGAATVTQSHKEAVFDEDTLDIGQHYTDNVYIHSKYRAEEEVILERKAGLKANIYRIGNLTWRSSDGVFQSNREENGFVNRVHATLKLGLFNDNMDKYPMDLTPVDECASAFVKLALLGHVNEIYHLYNQNFLKTRDMFDMLGVPYRYTSTAETVETAYANTADRDIHVYMFYLIISGRSANIPMKNDFTLSRLKETGFEWSLPDKRYLTLAPDGKKCVCLDYDKITLKPVRTGGGMTPIQKMTLGALHDAVLPERRVFRGAGVLCGEALKAIKEYCHRPLIITYHHALSDNAIKEFIASFGGECTVFTAVSTGEPTINDTDTAKAAYKNTNCASVIAIGGGSVLDLAKTTALRAANPEESLDNICSLVAEAKPCVPFAAVPTTSGTGSEATLFAVVTDTLEGKKKPFVSDKFLPHIVVLDPTLTRTLPKKSTAHTGIDALSHAVESYISLFAPSFDEDRAHAKTACKKIFANLKKAYDNPSDISARSELSEASYEAGEAFARISTGYVHAIAHRLGEFYHVPHGLSIAVCLAPVLKAYLPFASSELSELAVFCGFGDSACSDYENAEKFIDAVEKLIASLGIDKAQIEFSAEDLHKIVFRAQDEAKLTGYPRPFTDKELSELITEIFE